MQEKQTVISTETAPKPKARPTLYEKKLDLLKAEIDHYHSGIRYTLEKGMKILVISDNHLGDELDSDELRLIGGIGVLCRIHGAAMIFTEDGNLGAIATSPLSPIAPQCDTMTTDLGCSL